MYFFGKESSTLGKSGPPALIQVHWPKSPPALLNSRDCRTAPLIWEEELGSLRSDLRTPDHSGAFHEYEYGVIQKDGGPDSGYLWSSRLPWGSGFLGVQAFLEANSRFFTFQGGAFTESPHEPLSSSISWGAFLHGRGASSL